MEQKHAKVQLALICMIFGTVGTVAHFIAMPSSTISFYRALLGEIYLVGFLYFRQQKFDVAAVKSNIFIIILLGLCLGLNWVFQFEAFKVSTVAIGTVCYNTMPIFLILFSSVLFKEKVTIKTYVCIIFAIIGVVLVSNVLETGIKSSQVLGCLYGIAGAIFYALAVTLNRLLKKISAQDRLICQFFVALIILAFYIAFIQKGTFSFESVINRNTLVIGIICLLLLGLFHTGFCYVRYMNVITILPAGDIAIFTFIDPVVALFLSYFLLKEDMSPIQMLGAVIIIASMFVNELTGVK